MLRRIVLFCAALLGAATVSAQTVEAPPSPAGPRVVIETGEGRIVAELDEAHAPLTTANFLRYVDARRFDGASFYRAMAFGPGEGLIQGGLRGDPARLYPPVAHEPTTQTGLSHGAGTLSMARYEPGSATADFFITASPMPSLDADPAREGDNAGFAAFGHVVEGMEVVKRILGAPTSPTEGEGVMKGQMLEPKIRIISIRRMAAED